MDEENSLITELNSDQARAVDEVIGKKIWNIEILEDGDDSMIKIEFSENENDFMIIHANGMDLYIASPKPKVTH